MLIGRPVFGSSEYYKGFLDDVLIYNRALSPQEIDSLYHVGGWPYSGPVWYVSLSGNDTTGDGSVNNPFATPSRAVTSADNGDTIMISGGTYNSSVSISGKSNLTLIGTSRDSVFLSGGITLSNGAQYNQIRNLTFAGYSCGNYQSTAYNSIVHCRITGSSYLGIYQPRTTFSDNIILAPILNNTATFNLFERNLFKNCTEGIQFNGGFDCVVLDNVFDSVGTAIHYWGFFQGSHRMMIVNNTFSNCTTGILFNEGNNTNHKIVANKFINNINTISANNGSAGFYEYNSFFHNNDSCYILKSAQLSLLSNFDDKITLPSYGFVEIPNDSAICPTPFNGIIDLDQDGDNDQGDLVFAIGDYGIAKPFIGCIDMHSDSHSVYWTFRNGDQDQARTQAAYELQLDSTGTWDTPHSTGLVGGTAQFHDVSYLPRAKYYWRIRVQDNWGDYSAWTDGLDSLQLGSESQPDAPVLLTAIPAKHRVALTWRKSTASDFLRYRVYASLSPAPVVQVDSSTSLTDTTQIISGLLNDTTYYFRVAVLDSGGNLSAFSNELNAQPFNTAAIITQAIPDTSYDEDFGRVFVRRLKDVFFDPDGDTLTFQSYDLTSGVIPDISNDSLYLNSVSDDTTDGYIRITASDDEMTVADTFLIVVRNINDPPHVVVALRDTSFQEDFGERFMADLGTVFSDIDNAILSFEVYSPTSGVTARESNDSLYLSSVQNDTGWVNVRVTASDGEYTIADSFEVNLHNVNDDPDVSQPVTDRQMAEDSGKQFVTIVSSVFSDPEDDQLNYAAQAFNNKITTQISNDSLYVITSHDSNGMADVRLWATDPFSGIGSDTFRVTITPVNDGPIVVQTMADTTVLEDFGRVFHRHMTDVFFDVDGPLTYHTNGPPAGLNAVISGDSLYLESTLNDTGSVSVIVVANDGQDSAITSFQVNIVNVNDLVTLVTPLQDELLPKNFGRVFVANLDSVFHDVDNSFLQYSPAILGTGITADVVLPDSLFLNSLPNFFGEVDVRVGASDGQYSMSDTFRVTVTSNTAPYVTNALRDTSFDEDFGVRFIRKLSTAFADTESTILSYDVDVLTPGIHAQIVDSDSLFITDSLNFNGQAALRVTASDGVFQTPATFTVRVMPVNDPPVVNLGITNQFVREDTGRVYVATLSSVFFDPDTNALSYTVSLSNARMTGLVSSDSLYLTTMPDSNGTVTAIVTASDQFFQVQDTFVVTISAVNDAPFVANPVSDFMTDANFGRRYVVFLPAVFGDVETQALSYGVNVLVPGVKPQLSHDSLYVNDSLNFVGQSRLVVTASDGELAVSDTIFVTVEGVAPAILTSALSITPVAPNVGQSVTITIGVSGTVPDVWLKYGNGILDQYDSTRMTSTNGTTYSSIIPGGRVTSEGVWFRIEAKNQYGSTVYYPSPSGRASIRVGVIDVTSIKQEGAFPRGLDNLGYSTISLPLIVSSPIPLAGLLGGQEFNGRGEPVNWVCYRHIPGAVGDTSFNSVTSLKNGEAYFLYQVVQDTVDVFSGVNSGFTYPPDTLNSLVLKPGWNLVPWPYCHTSNITPDLDAIEIPQIKEGAGWHVVGSFRPFGAYAIKNRTSSDVLFGDVLSWEPTIASLLRPIPRPSASWHIKFEALAGPYTDRHNIIGVAANASDLRDRNDMSEAMMIGNGISLSFGESTSEGPLAYDVRSSQEDGHVWDMSVANQTPSASVTISWTPWSIPDEYGLMLIDFANNLFVALDSVDRYTYRARDENKFKVIVGTHEYVNAEIEIIKAQLPQEFALYQNYPNPFNPQTAIPYDLARSGHVRLRIYNVLGQEVLTLFNGYAETGHYVKQWDGRDRLGNRVGSGVYIFRLEADGFVKSRKMVLVK